VGTVTETDDRPADRAVLATVAVLAILVIVATFSRTGSAATDQRLAQEFPVGAVSWLEVERPPHELFNTFDWGGYLMWQAPDYPVSIDGRTDVYDEYLEVYDATVRARPGWQEELDREGIGTVLVDPGLPLTAALRAEPGWSVGYEDDVAVVFTRAGPVPERR